MSQHLEALAKGQAIRVRAVQERNSLIGRPVGEIERVIETPSKPLASMKLRILLLAGSRERMGIIPYFGPERLRKALRELDYECPLTRRLWGPDMRLRELTARQRQMLVRALVRHAPREWRES